MGNNLYQRKLLHDYNDFIYILPPSSKQKSGLLSVLCCLCCLCLFGLFGSCLSIYLIVFLVLVPIHVV